ncbi:MAG: hypothetical protein HY300_18020 [Verrucomicrobia bacterium]|nr:hypothetical protein [Verrucomicrobiota bacterium]
MAGFENPALKAFVANIEDEFVFGQVFIRREAGGYGLRHAADRDAAERSLHTMPPERVRTLAQSTAAGAFRPLKSAPDLQRGWHLFAHDDAALEGALNQIYPGGIADWFAAQSSTPPVTDWREFTARQSGMYRITTMLTDAQVAQVIRAGCHASLCLKRRLWTVEGLAPDAAADKSCLPCLEPCAVLLEFARKTMRVEQEAKAPCALAPSELDALEATLEVVLSLPACECETGASAPGNPRRLRLLLEKLRAAPRPVREEDDAGD